MAPSRKRGGACGVVLLAAALLFALGAVAQAETVRIGKSSDISFTFIPLDIGIQQKFFQQNGVDVEEIIFAGGAKMHQAMIAGSVDLGLGSGADVALMVKGLPGIGVGAIALTPALFGIVLPYDSAVHALADLKGKKIGVTATGTVTDWIALQIVKKEGWQRSDLMRVEIGGTTAEIAALKTKAIDALVSAEALGFDLEQRKEARVLMPASDFIGPFLLNMVDATQDFADHHADALRGFLKGWYEAVDYMASHKAESDALAQKITHFSSAVQEEQYDVVMPSMSRDGSFQQAVLDPTAQSFIDLGVLLEKPDMTKYLTTRYLPKH